MIQNDVQNLRPNVKRIVGLTGTPWQRTHGAKLKEIQKERYKNIQNDEQGKNALLKTQDFCQEVSWNLFFSVK